VLTKSQAAAENFPFCTIDPNESMNVDYWFLSPLLCAKLIVVSDFEVTQSNDLCYNTTNKHDNMMQEYVRYAK